MIFST